MRYFVLVLGLMVGGGAAVASAQTTADGSVRGTVRDAQGSVLPGATVTATGTSVTFTRTAVSDAAGEYRLISLPPGDYAVHAELSGFQKVVREGVAVRAGLNIAIDFELSVGALTEVVSVRAESPMLEVSNATQAVNIRGELQRSLPLSARRDWADFLYVTPGIVGTESPGISGLFYLHGADFSSHVLQVDGADVTSAQQGFNGFVNLNTDALEDVQIKTGAVDAASPIGLGSVVNVATVSGSNTLHGSASVVLQDQSWNGNNTPGGTSTKSEIFQPDLSIGGPVLRDKWYFYAAYRYTRTAMGVNRTDAQVQRLRALVPGFEPFDAQNRAHFTFAKTTLQINPNHQALFSVLKDANPSDQVQPIDAARFINRGPEGTAYTARLSSIWGASTTSRLLASYNNKANQIRTLRDDAPSRQVHLSAFASGGRLDGSGAIAQLDNSNNGSFVQPYDKITLSADLTHFRRGWFGSHEFQVGIYAQPLIRIDSRLIIPNNGFLLEELVAVDPNDLSRGTRPFHRQVYDRTEIQSSLLDSSDYAFYLQDAWRPSDRLTVSAGLRVDVIDRTDKLFDQKVQDSVELGPRVGLNYMLTADRQNSLRASWSRVHESLAQNIISAGSNTAAIQDLYDTDLNGTFETVFDTPAATRLNPSLEFDPDRNQPSADEFVIGYRRQLPGQTAIDVSWLRRTFRDRTAYVETNRIIEDGVFRGYRDVNRNDVFLVTENIWNQPVYNGFEIQASRQTQALQVIASYSRQWRSLHGTWQPNDIASILQPGAFANDRGIGNTKGAQGDANSLSGTAQAGYSGWRDHTIRAAAAWQGPWGLLLAANATYQSGPWSGPIVTRIAAPDPRFGPPTVTLSNGRVVSNPLATTIRFAGATRSEGQFAIDAMTTYNLRVGRRFRFGARALDASVDIYNVANNDADQSMLFGGNQQYNPSFGLGSSRQLPRSAQVTLRYTF